MTLEQYQIRSEFGFALWYGRTLTKLEVLRNRAKTLRQLNVKPKARKAILALCRKDPVYWIENFVYTHDPRLLGEGKIPFIPFHFQVEMLDWLEMCYRRQVNGGLDKSRDSGATWIAALWALHKWLFEPRGFDATIASQKEEKVDKLGNPDTIFEKMRMVLRELPKWMLPKRYREKQHATFKRFINPVTNATIIGESGYEIGRGGRRSVIIIDEAAFLEHPDNVYASISQTTRCTISVSTPNGQGNYFFRLIHLGKNPKFRIHWKKDPRKNEYFHVEDPQALREFITIRYELLGEMDEEDPNAYSSAMDLLRTAILEEFDECEILEQDYGEAEHLADPVYLWYEFECLRMEGDLVKIAQELDIDYSASIEGVCIPTKWIMAAVDFAKVYDFSEIMASFKKVCGFDVADGGANEHFMIFRKGPVVTGGLGWKHTTSFEAAKSAKEFAVQEGVFRVYYDGDGPGLSIRDEWELRQAELQKQKGAVKFPFEVSAVHGNDEPTNHLWPDGRRSYVRFQNLRAELWWKLRERFRKTYEFRKLGIYHPLDELISIPNDQTLIIQLGSPLMETNSTGKQQLEAKPAMKKRGVASPDRADALAYSFAPPPKVRKPKPAGKSLVRI